MGWKPMVNSKYIEKHCAILVGFIGEGGGRYPLSSQCLNSEDAVSQGTPASPGSGRTKKAQTEETVQHPNSYFMDVKCPGCYRITTVFSHAQTVVVCSGCSTVLC